MQSSLHPGKIVVVRRARSRRGSRVEVGEVLRAADTLADPDYAAAFEVRVGAQVRSAEQWARILFEDAPLILRRAAVGAGGLVGRSTGPSPNRAFALKLRGIASVRR